MDIRQISHFVSVFESLNFSQSAKELFITQPALSKSIRALETELGVKLFERNSHGVFPTEAGKTYYRHAVNILENAQNGDEALKQLVTGSEGTLRISTIPSLQEQVVKSISSFHEKYPNIQITIEVQTGYEQLLSIVESNLDIYFSYSSLLHSALSLDSVPLFQETLGLFLPEKMSANVTGTDFSALQGEKLLVERRIRGPYIFNDIKNICKSRGLNVEKDLITLNNLTSVCLSVSAGIGFTVNPMSISKAYYSKNVKIIPLPGEDALITYGVGWKNNHQNPSITKYVEVFHADHDTAKTGTSTSVL